ncbi:MAG: DUF3592 domain-containing protein [bacterium]
MSLRDLFRRKQEDEASRFSRLATRGRITDGIVIDIKSDELGHITHVFFTYNVAGVEYESSQELNAEQRSRENGYSPGAAITVRYDPRQPGNSVVV